MKYIYEPKYLSTLGIDKSLDNQITQTSNIIFKTKTTLQLSSNKY